MTVQKVFRRIQINLYIFTNFYLLVSRMSDRVHLSLSHLSQELRKYKENEKDTEVLMSALSAMQEKTQHLENSLSAETRIKLDLFSALGDAKRQLEIAQGSSDVDEGVSKGCSGFGCNACCCQCSDQGWK